ncbi:hypothetical protein FCH28_31440 [Streptomyces piniterrae]|uniref:DUF4034 domain-containing protein n=1 Tax=Streptomyces piniterrae TaxID=2571125 RepID=A0A4U0MT43_9ACTN|nr:hypothetical protein [Streptomyces piniterrae]TJZ44115.1 hypothetical protein FCH28_31440 [Streptomyces piniterrae]
MARGRRGGSGGEEFRPAFHPAGFDHELRAVVEDLRVGRWMTTRDLLARTGAHWALRTSRSQVLSAVAAGSHTVEAWLTEEPHSADARMMRARVAVARATQAHGQQHPRTGELTTEARQAGRLAAHAAPDDPVPWICLLGLARLDVRRELPEHRERPWELMLPAGPWGLLYEVYVRDRFNREAYHRMLQYFHSLSGVSPAAAIDFARWVVSWAPEQSPLRVLPLYACAEHYHRRRRQGSDDPLLYRQWARDPIVQDIDRALSWFHHTPPGSRSVLDLNHLAHALWAGRRYAQSAPVFAALGPYATRFPWAYMADDPSAPDAAETVFLKARRTAQVP